MFWTFKLSFVVDILAFFDLATFWAILWKIWLFVSNLLVALSEKKKKSFITSKLDRDDAADSGKGWPSSSPLPGLAGLYQLGHATISVCERKSVLSLDILFLKGNKIKLCLVHRHLSNKDCLMACTACLVCFISTVNGCRKKGKCLGRCGASSGHTTKLEQSIFFRYL